MIIIISFNHLSPFLPCVLFYLTQALLSTGGPVEGQMKTGWTVSVPVAQTTQVVRVRSITASHSAKRLGFPCLSEEGSLDPVVSAVNSAPSSLYCLQHRGLFPATDEVYVAAISSCHNRSTDLSLDTPVWSCFYRGLRDSSQCQLAPVGPTTGP